MRPATTLLSVAVLAASVANATPLPIDPLWKSESFRKVVTGSFGIDSRIEPIITTDEEFYLKQSAEKMAANDRKGAIAALAESSIYDRSPAMLFNLATLQYEEDDKEKAKENFAKALALFPNFRDAHRNLAVLLVQDTKFDDAETHLIRALELGAGDGLTYGLLGYCHASREHYQAAFDAYRLALMVQPKERQWKLGAAQCLLALDRPRESASLLQQLIDAAPEETGPWLIQCDAWNALEDRTRAATNLEIAHRMDALDANATLSLGHLYMQGDLPDLALERYRTALTATEPAAPARAVEALELILSNSDWSRGKELAALFDSSEFYKKELAPEGENKALLSRLIRARAFLELETGDTKIGAERLADWVQREPLDGAALVLLARFHETDGKREEAEMLFEQAERIPASAASAHLAHGRLLVTVGEYASALDHLEKSNELNSNEALSDYIRAIRDLADASVGGE